MHPKFDKQISHKLRLEGELRDERRWDLSVESAMGSITWFERFMRNCQRVDMDKSESLTNTGELGHLRPSHVFSSCSTNK